jgi:hypothetical protein
MDDEVAAIALEHVELNGTFPIIGLDETRRLPAPA